MFCDITYNFDGKHQRKTSLLQSPKCSYCFTGCGEGSVVQSNANAMLANHVKCKFFSFKLKTQYFINGTICSMITETCFKSCRPCSFGTWKNASSGIILTTILTTYLTTALQIISDPFLCDKLFWTWYCSRTMRWTETPRRRTVPPMVSWSCRSSTSWPKIR